jgi:hypothetical protein
VSGLDRLITGHKISSLGRTPYHVMAKCDRGSRRRTIDDGSGKFPTPWPDGLSSDQPEGSDTVGVEVA